MVYYKNKYDCVIIDSGVKTNHKVFDNKIIRGLTLHKENGKTVVDPAFDDSVGHGTSIYYIISRCTNDKTQILNIKIADKMEFDDEDLLIDALNYINDNIICKVINISMGIVQCLKLNKLKNVCDKLKKKGVIIVAAFDNNGAISYPAAFSSVVGVDVSRNCVITSDIEFVEDSVVNILAKGGIQKVPWIKPEFAFVYGASFAAAYVSSVICNYLSDNSASFCEVMLYLKSISKKIHTRQKDKIKDSIKYVKPKKALLFPCNKEIKSLIAFNSLLECEIFGVCDLHVSGNVSKKLDKLIEFKDLGNLCNQMILDFDKIDWDNDFDTIIVGHVEDISQLIKRNIISEILEKCCLYNKNIICFDDISSYTYLINKITKSNCNCYYPSISMLAPLENRFGKLHISPMPIVCIAGTSSSQGKYTLQLFLRELFLKENYRVGQFVTEPSGLLFGCDEVYHYGYDVYNTFNYEDTVMIVNEKINSISEKKPDIIIAGLQAGMVPVSSFNICYLTNRQLEIMTGIMPDVIVLCINTYDDIKYIKRTIKCIESFVNTVVLCCAVYPFEYDDSFTTFYKKRKMTEIDLEEYIRELTAKLNIPVFPINAFGSEKIFRLLIDFFKEEEA